MSFNIREALRQSILNNAAISALVEERVWETFAPTGTALPVWIVFTKLYSAETGGMDGDQNLTEQTFQLTVGGTNKESCDAVLALLVKFNCTEYTYADATGDHILTFFHHDDRDEWDEKTRTFLGSVDLVVWANN